MLKGANCRPIGKYSRKIRHDMYEFGSNGKRGGIMEVSAELRLRFLEARLINAFQMIYEHDEQLRQMRKEEN